MDPQLEQPSPASAIAHLCRMLQPGERPTEHLPLDQARGRILAEEIRSDRPSPPFDASAMDGYALRAADLNRQQIRIVGECLIGKPPAELRDGAMKIMTGAPVPAGADLVVKREDVEEHSDHIRLSTTVRETRPGDHIRRRGENAPSNAPVLAPGQILTGASIATLASFGATSVPVKTPVSIRIITTGNEVVPPHTTPSAWEIRNSNDPALHAIVDCPHARVTSRSHIGDTREQTADDIADALGHTKRGDALLLTGGVSMGDHDHVPDALREAGCHVVFHRVQQRPGRPLLGAIGPSGQLVAGLPGNPLSVMVSARRILRPLIDQQAGIDGWNRPPGAVEIEGDERSLHLWWHRLVQWDATTERYRLVAGRGSGDVAAAGRSDGFVELPPGHTGNGPWPLYTWD